MEIRTLVALASVILARPSEARNADGSVAQPTAHCRCIPGQPCWPTDATWAAFNSTIGGKLIKSVPVAQACYSDPPNSDECARVNALWADDAFQTSQALGRYYPFNMTCPPRTAGQVAGACTLGQLPEYAVDATERQYIRETLRFVRDNNIRVTVVNTGHDQIGRTDRFGSLAIWVRNLRNAINWQDKFESATRCTESNWTGNAIDIDGAYQWGDVYEVAKERNVVVVGGGSATVGANGGWLSGGGHGPASRTYGLGADQLLEAEVMLADGSIVIANHCENRDLFKALRGGGPGYGIVLGTKVKAYPNDKQVTAHKLLMTPKAESTSDSHLLEAASVMLQSLPSLNDGGYAGYVLWQRSSYYHHSLFMIGEGVESARKIYGPVRKKLAHLQGRLHVVTDNFTVYRDYWSFYAAELGRGLYPGQTLLTTSRMLDKKSVEDSDRVRHTVEVVSGQPEEGTLNLVLLVSGGKVFEDAADQSSGLHPAWRTSPMVHLTVRNISHSRTLAETQRRAMADDITFSKGSATKQLAPDTGGYMNEGDRNDPDYMVTFYGANYKTHLAAKNKYDPSHVFYCPTCVGAEQFIDRPDGALCKVQ